MPASSDSIYIMVSTLMHKETKLKTRASFFMLFPFPYTVKPLVSSRLENLYKTAPREIIRRFSLSKNNCYAGILEGEPIVT